MDLKIKIGSALTPQEKIVAKTDTPKALLTAMNVAYRDGDVSLNGGVLGTADMSKTLEALNVKDGDFILVTAKQNSGKGC